MPEPVLIRSFEHDDQEPIRTIWHAAISEESLDGFEPHDVDHLVDRLPAESSGFFVAAGEQGVAGFLDADSHVVVVRKDLRRRGIGRLLFDTAERSLRDSGAVRLLLWLPGNHDPAAKFYQALGLSCRRFDLPADTSLPEPDFPPETASTTVDAVDIDSYVELFNVAIREHPTPAHLTREIVERSRTKPSSDPTMILVLFERTTGRPIGFYRAAHDRSANENGEVRFIGLLPEWRGQSLGKELLAWGVNRSREAGARGVSLTVEGENENTIALYEHAGFVASREWRRYGRSLR